MWRNWDDWTPPGFVPGIVYASTLRELSTKGIICHTQRTSILTVIQSTSAVIWIRSPDNPDKTHQVRCVSPSEDGDEHVTVVIPPNHGVLFQNPSPDQEATVLVVGDLPWRPDWDDTVKFLNWEEWAAWAKGVVKL